jgi:hypothetical protein
MTGSSTPSLTSKASIRPFRPDHSPNQHCAQRRAISAPDTDTAVAERYSTSWMGEGDATILHRAGMIRWTLRRVDRHRRINGSPRLREDGSGMITER